MTNENTDTRAAGSVGPMIRKPFTSLNRNKAYPVSSCSRAHSSAQPRAANEFEKCSGRGQSTRSRHVRRACFKLQSALGKMSGSPIQYHLMRHIAASLIRRHVVENLLARPQRSDSHGARHLMSREGQEITTEALHIDREM